MSIWMLTPPYPGTRSSKATHDLDDQIHSTHERPVKRRRIESSQNDGSSIKHPMEDSAAVDAPDQPDDIDTDLKDLHTQLIAHSQLDGPEFKSGAAPTEETTGQLNPEMARAISDIIDHSERFEQYCAMGAADEDALSGSKSLVFAKTGSRMKVESLPILDNLVSTNLCLRRNTGGN
jgi:hypothetical protein